MIRTALRLIAIAIALAAAIDPSIAIDAATRPRVALVVQDPRVPDAARARDDLIRELRADHEIVPNLVSDAAAAIVIGDRYPGDPVPNSMQVMTVTIPQPSDGVRIVRIAAPREVPPATRIQVDVDVVAPSAAGRTTELRARVAGIDSSTVSHRWTQAGEHWRASLDVVPVGGPPFVVRVGATTRDVAGAPASSAADIVVQRRTMPLAVEFVDARPSWASTFVRRALEADPRFQIESVNSESRGITATTPGAVPLGDAQLDRFDVVVLGGLDRLTANDVAAVRRYMGERGGAVVLLPDGRVDSAPARPLLPEFTERVLEQPVSLVPRGGGAALRASELLVVRTPAPGTDVVMRTPAEHGDAVVVSKPFAAGRILVSGAMDAWRYRATDEGAFDRFWRSTIAGLALAAAPAIDVEVAPAILRPRDAALVTVRVRRGEPAWVTASFGGQPVRLVPGPERGVYRGRLTAGESANAATLDVQALDDRGERTSALVSVPIVADAQAPAGLEPPLALVSASHHGIDVSPGRTREIVDALRQSVHSTRATEQAHPMRSPWWLLPFVACLSAEWWLRRRRGLR
jgi:hypothetical protein